MEGAHSQRSGLLAPIMPCPNVSMAQMAPHIHSQQPWFENMVSADMRKCRHTFNFFHYFLPHIECPTWMRVGRCGDGSKIICGVPLLAARKQCVIYSFGSSGDSCFESAAAKLMPHCQIHIFDPTSESLTSPRWTYHGWGIGGHDANETRYYNWRTQRAATCTGCAMRTLKETMEILRHEHVDVLKVDVDGAEWRAFEAIFDDFHGGPLPFGQLQIEATGLDITAENSSRIAQFWRKMAQNELAVFHLETNLGTCSHRQKYQGTSVEYALLNTQKELRLTARCGVRPFTYTAQFAALS
eukprot:6639735-Prymnesium_polylepis.1